MSASVIDGHPAYLCRMHWQLLVYRSIYTWRLRMDTRKEPLESRAPPPHLGISMRILTRLSSVLAALFPCSSAKHSAPNHQSSLVKSQRLIATEPHDHEICGDSVSLHIKWFVHFINRQNSIHDSPISNPLISKCTP